MKPIKFFALTGLFTAISLLLPAIAQVKPKASFSQFHNYVVIGAFAVHKNAVKFTSYAKAKHQSARYEKNPERNLYYVYVLGTDDRDAAIAEATKLRTDSEFSDTWVYSIAVNAAGGTESSIGVDINPVTKARMETVPVNAESSASTGEWTAKPSSTPAAGNTKTPSSTAGSSTAKPSASSSETPSSYATTSPSSQASTTDAPSNTSATPAETSSSTPDRGDSEEISGKAFNFNVYRSIDNKTVEGDVDVIDSEKARKIGSYKGNTQVRVSTPSNKSGEVSLICEVFGYRKVQREINFQTPQGEGITEENGSVNIPFELVRLQKGDIAVMYNVYFFKDAGVMRPESRYEINSLLEMLKENPNYKIRIHGHTNGSSHGKIISMGESKNFFSLTDTKEGFGSAKKLSYERAKVIHEYLTSNGIDEKRTQVKAWGGKRPVQDKHSTRANENVRVEIEILED